MKKKSKRFATRKYAVREGARVRLDKWPTRVSPVYGDDDDYRDLLSRHVSRLSDLQELLYATNRFALLVVFQGMDTAGKDGAIKHVMTGINPQGCSVTSFKHPSGIELQHDFLWRAAQALPERGRIGIFNRSYYEEVVVVRVHPELLKAEGLPDASLANGKVWHARYRSIKGLEDHLTRSGMRVVKFFLHVSKDEQRERLLARIDDPDKRWKFRAMDVEERDFWDGYMEAYGDCIEATSTEHAPWYVVPADDKRNARLIVSQVIVETLEALDMRCPELGAAEAERLRSFRDVLLA
jgi:PPK2 family polyphosphate:nucleotide phosphotransferase